MTLTESLLLGAYGTSKKLEEVGKERLFLYPTYVNWCKRMGTKPYANRRFTQAFNSTCKEMKISVEKSGRKYGTVYKGVAIDRKVGELRYQIGDGREVEGDDDPKIDPQVSTSGDTHEV